MSLNQLFIRSFRPAIGRPRRRRNAVRHQQAIVDVLESRLLLTVPDPIDVLSAESLNPETQQRVELTWESVDDAINYEYWISELGIGRVAGGTVSETSTVVGVQYGAYMRAWARATNDMGTGDWGPGFDFVAGSEAPAQPTFITTDGYSTDNTPTYQWFGDGRATSYDVWVSKDGISGPFLQTSSTNVSFTPDPAFDDGAYTVWVRSRNALGVSAWSESVTTGVGSSQIEVSGPTEPAAPSQPTITWTEGVPGVPYELWVNQVGGTDMIINAKDIDETSFTPSVDLSDGVYDAFVRQKASNLSPLPWSNSFRFEVGTDTIPGEPVIGSGTNYMATFTWEAVTNAARYEVWVSDVDIGRIIDDQVTELEYTTTPLSGGNYRAWVRSLNAAGIPGDWSDVLNFHVTSAGEVIFN